MLLPQNFTISYDCLLWGFPITLLRQIGLSVYTMLRRIGIPFALAAALLILVTPACRKQKVENEKKRKLNAGEWQIEKIDATRKDLFACVNFATGEVEMMTAEDSKHSREWDLAISTFYFKTNSGMSGPGKGGAFLTKTEDTRKVKLADYKSIPTDEQWVIDEEGIWNSKAGRDRMDYGKFSETGINHLFTSQYKNNKEYLFSDPIHVGLVTSIKEAMPPTFRIEEAIFFVRCADGKIAKCRIAPSGEVTFQYQITYIYDVK